MEVEFLNLGLDIIGLGVFNYDFGSITTESPVIKVRQKMNPHKLRRPELSALGCHQDASEYLLSRDGCIASARQRQNPALALTCWLRQIGVHTPVARPKSYRHS